MTQRPDYGIDSPAIVASEAAVGATALAAAAALAGAHAPPLARVPTWAIAAALGGYFLLAAGGMAYYSRVGKLRVRNRLLDVIPWRGDERVLDVGCGRGLLLVGAAKRLHSGRAVGVDLWLPSAVSGNSQAAARCNAEREGVADRIELLPGDARHLPLDDACCDVVLSNFVLHEVASRADRERMLREMVRVLKPGGWLALADFIFTGEAVRTLRACGLTDVRRAPAGALDFWASAIVSFGLTQIYAVTGHKRPEPSAAG